MDCLGSVRWSQCYVSEWLDEMETCLAYIDFHVHEGHGTHATLDAAHAPNPHP